MNNTNAAEKYEKMVQISQTPSIRHMSYLHFSLLVSFIQKHERVVVSYLQMKTNA